MSNKSLLKNATFNVMKTFATIVIPFIIFPYISRVLDVESIGKWNYANSIVSYFTIIASFGINEYATRNGAQIRNKSDEFKIFANQMFTMNCIFSLFSFSLMVIIAYNCRALEEYKNIICLLGISVLIIPLSFEWLYNIFEDFVYISVRVIIIQIISAILIFIFVKNKNDLMIYVAITVVANVISVIINFIHSKSFYRPKIVININFMVHFRYLCVFLINSIASTIYLNSDIVLLGILSNNYSVGLYSAATKIYSIIKQIFNSVILTMIPRLSFLASNKIREFEKLLKTIISITFIFVVPSSIGVFLLRKEIIYIVVGNKYSGATTSLGILAFATIFAVFSNIFVNGIMIPRKMEKKVVKATLFSSGFNVLANLFAIRLYSQNGAAVTTLLAELLLLSINIFFAKDILNKILDGKTLIHACIASLFMILMYSCTRYILNIIACDVLIEVGIIIFVCSLSYFIVLLLCKDKVVLSIISLFKIKIKKCFCRYY